MGIVVAEDCGMMSLAVEERAVCRLVWVFGLVFGGIWRKIGKVGSMEATRCRYGRSN